MIKMLIVDDEPIARKHVRNSFPWEIWGITIIGEATNGAEALLMCEKEIPDIALVDITMPVMNGFQLLDELKKHYPDVQTIFVTAHRSFEFAQKAIQKGSVGYILKSPINIDESKEVFQKVCSDINKKYQEKDKDKKLLHNYGFPLRQKFFSNLIDFSLISKEEMIEEAKSVGIHLNSSSSYYILLCTIKHTEVDDFEKMDHSMYVTEMKVYEMLSEFFTAKPSFSYELFPTSSGHLIVIIESSSTPFHTIQELSSAIILKIQAALSMDLKFFITTSRKVTNIENIKSKYGEILNFINYINFYNNHSTPLVIESCDNPLITCSEMQEAGTLFSSIVRNEDHNGLEKWLRDLEQLCLMYKFDPTQLTMWFHNLREMQEGELYEHFPDFKESVHFDDVLKKIKNWFLRENKDKEVQVNSQIADALKYIEENLDQDLSLNTIADSVYLSPSYFGRMFKSQMGLSIIDYILEQRITKAKRLMKETKFRNYEIAEKVGFQNYSYFSTVFKKHEKKSPNEYRSSLKETVRLSAGP